MQDSIDNLINDLAGVGPIGLDKIELGTRLVFDTSHIPKGTGSSPMNFTQITGVQIDNFKYESLLLVVTSTKPKGNMFSALILSMR